MGGHDLLRITLFEIAMFMRDARESSFYVRIVLTYFHSDHITSSCPIEAIAPFVLIIL